MISCIGVKDGYVFKITGNTDTYETADKALEEAYQQGLNDAWEAARKALRYTDYQLFVLFDIDNIYDIITHLTASEVIEKIKKYEERQKVDNEIKIGDWVFNKHVGVTSSAKVTCVEGQKVYMLCGDGSCGFADMADLKKTNVPNPKIEQLLEMLKGEQRNCSTYKHDGDSRFCNPCRHNDMWEPKEGAE